MAKAEEGEGDEDEETSDEEDRLKSDSGWCFREAESLINVEFVQSPWLELTFNQN